MKTPQRFLPPDTWTALLLPELLSEERCRTLLHQLDEKGFKPTGAEYPASYRNNDRIVFDDPELAAALWPLVAECVPNLKENGELWVPQALNPRFRACRYRDGQAFSIHRDGAYHPATDQRSFLTLQFYLNDGASFAGGRTRFYADASGERMWAAVKPVLGTGILFDHRAWHDGECVPEGTKMVLRTDVLFRKQGRGNRPARGSDRVQTIGEHRGYVWRVLERRDGALASCSRDGTVALRNPASADPPFIYDLGAGSVTALAEDPAGRLWCGTRSGKLFWLGENAQLVGDCGAAILDLLPVGDSVMGALSSGEVVKFESDRLRWRRRVHDGWVWALARIGDTVLSAGEDGQLVGLEADGSTRTLWKSDGPLLALATAGSQLLIGDAGGGIRQARAPDFDRSTRVVGHRLRCTALAVAGGHWLSGGEDGTVHLWEGACRLASWEGTDHVRSVAFTASGWLRAGYDGRIARLTL